MANVPDNIDWRSVNYVQANDASWWQRALLDPRLLKDIKVKEGETTTIFGTAEPNAEVQIFLFAPEVDGDRNLIAPSSQGNCFQVGTADEDGNFSFDIHARVLWGLLEKQVAIDAFFKLDDSWKPAADFGRNGNFSMGSFNFLRIPFVTLGEGSEQIPSTCEPFFPDSPYCIASELRPDEHRHVARGSFPFLEGDPNNTVAEKLYITKISPLTFYTLVPKYVDEDVRGGSGIFVIKSLTVELIKRMLLGFNGGMATPLKTLAPQEILMAADDASTSDTQELLQAIRDALTHDIDSTERKAGLTIILEQIEKIFPYRDDHYVLPDMKTLEEIFPATNTQPTDFISTAGVVQRDANSWATDLQEIFALWTNDSVGVNEKLMLTENPNTIFRYFAENPIGLPGAPTPIGGNPDIGTDPEVPVDPVIPELPNAPAPIEEQPEGDTVEGPVGPPPPIGDNPPIDDGGDMGGPDEPPPPIGDETDGGDVCDPGCNEFEPGPPQGEDPVLVITKTGPVTLAPVFTNMLLSRSTKSFSENEMWEFNGEVLPTLSYEYTSVGDFAPTVSSTSCLSGVDVSEYAQFLTQSLSLPHMAKDFIESELLTKMRYSSDLYAISIATPSEISDRLSWEIDGQIINIPQVYFQLQQGQCFEKDIVAPNDVLREEISHSSSDIAFEIGILK